MFPQTLLQNFLVWHHLCIADGSKMEFVNVEVWGLTPCLTVEEAQLMENRHLFLKRNATI
jgi:hypothetical protein